MQANGSHWYILFPQQRLAVLNSGFSVQDVDEIKLLTAPLSLFNCPERKKGR